MEEKNAPLPVVHPEDAIPETMLEEMTDNDLWERGGKE
jgi:hypothetical protein